MRLFTYFILACLFINQLNAIPPDPPHGKRWVLNDAFSDEFNGTELDDAKWHNYHPQWKGRPPALFMQDAVSVKDGYLQISNYKFDKDTVIWNWNHTDTDTYTMAGGAVRSKSNQAFYGYYECKFKASKTSMSTTFWLSSDHTVSIPGCATGKEKYGLELDIQECVGRVDNSGSDWFTSGMHSNTHFHYTTCEGEKDTRSRGAKVDSDLKCAESFNTYGAWWKDDTEVDYIFNDTEVRNVQFRTDILADPFNFPMCMNLVTETYDWISTPKTENLNDPTKNTSYYDWVRSYVLVDVDEEEEQSENLLVNGDFETGTAAGWEGWGGNPRELDETQPYDGDYCFHIAGAGAPEQVIVLNPNTNYTLTAYAKAVKGSVAFGVKNNGTGVHLQDVAVSGENYEKFTLNFTTDNDRIYKVFYYASTTNDEGYIDNVVLSEDGDVEVEETVMFPENVSFEEKPAVFNNASPFEFTSIYMANANRELHLAIVDKSEHVVSEQVYQALCGYGNKNLSLAVAGSLQEGINYKAKIYIRPLSSSDNIEAYASDEFNFQVSNPKDVTFILKDSRTSLPISGAELIMNGITQTTNEEGTTEFQDIPVTQHQVNISAAGYTSKNISVDVTGDLTMEYTMNPELYRIYIYAKDSITHEPISGATMIVDGVNRKTDSEGKSFFNLYFDAYTYSVNDASYGKISDTLIVSSTDDISLFMARQFTDVDFKVMLDDKAFGYADVTLGDNSRKASFSGTVSFTNIQTLVPLKYTIEYQGKLWFEDSARFYSDTLVNINLYSNPLKQVSHDEMQAFPNPVESQLYISGLNHQSKYTVYQTNGITLMNGIYIPGKAIDVEHLKSGVFFISFEDGRKISFMKLKTSN